MGTEGAVVVTGASGFSGAALVQALRRPAAPNAKSVAEVIATDRDSADISSDIGDPALIESLFERPVHRVFHLAGIVSGRAEADFALGKHVNLDATLALGELLVDDYTRRGFVDSRALRLSGVLLRPPTANEALSGFNSDVIREPLAGREYTCPVGPAATLWITSLRSTVHNLLALADAEASSLGAQRAVTAPALAIRVGDIVAALGRIDSDAPERVSYAVQPAIEAQFGRWPLACRFDRALALGLLAETSIDALLGTCLEPR